MLKIRTVRSFCRKHLEQYTSSRKDTFYRFKARGYRWRSFLYYIMKEIWKVLKIEETPGEERCFIIDDSILPKRGRDIENVSFVYDHTVGRSVLGYTVVTLGLFTGTGMYALDFSYKYGKKRHPKSTEERVGDARSISGQMSREASMYSKLELALMMLKRAVSHGLPQGMYFLTAGIPGRYSSAPSGGSGRIFMSSAGSRTRRCDMDITARNIAFPTVPEG
ncbi:MAG: transposase [Desulfomonilia bacterium]